MPTPRDPKEPKRGFEALLQPMQEVIAKDWQVRLKSYLERYIEYLHKFGDINFSEAAIIVHNTSAYYSRRVDLMYQWVRDFCMNLNTNNESGSHAGEKNEGQRGKKNKKKEEDDTTCSGEIEKLDFANNGKVGSLRVALEKLGVDDLKSTLLNTNSKAINKPGTSCPIYQSNNEDMGYKEEFRIHGKLYFNARMYCDIIKSVYILKNGDIDDYQDNFEGEEGMDIDGICDMSFDRTMDVDIRPPTPLESPRIELDAAPIENVIEQHCDNAPEYSPIDDENGDYQPLVTLEDIDPFNRPIPISKFIIHSKFIKRVVFSLPKELIAEAREIAKRNKKKESYNLSFSEILGGKSEDMVSFKMTKKQAQRKKTLLRNKKATDVPQNEADENMNVDDDHHNDFDDSLAVLRDGEACPPRSESFSREQGLAIDNAFVEARRLAQKTNKRGNVLAVQRRVAEWHAAIEPALKESEARSKFDVHEYGTKILEQFEEVGETKSFFDVVKVNNSKDVCRYFLSTLMLANTYNVELSKSDPSDLKEDCLQLKLLSTVRHHEELDANIGEAAGTTTH